MADPQTLDLVRARRARKLATTPPPSTAPAGLRPTPADAPADAPEKPSAAHSFLRGIADGAVFGLGDEGTGLASMVVRPMLDRWNGIDPEFSASATEAYREGRDDDRALQKLHQDTNPRATVAGKVVGGVAVPMPLVRGATTGARVLSGAAVGAGAGALQGVGDAEELRDIPDDLATGGLVGGVVGGTLPLVGAGLRATKGIATSPTLRGKVADAADWVVGKADAHPILRDLASPVAGPVVGGARILQKVRPKAPPAAPIADDVTLRLPRPEEEATQRSLRAVPFDDAPYLEPTETLQRGDITRQLDDLKVKMGREATQRPPPDVTQQVQATDVLESTDVLARAQALAEAPTQVRTAPSNWSMTPDKFAGKYGPDDALAQAVRGQTPPVPSAPAAARHFEDVTNTVPRLDMGEVEQMLQDVRADLKTPPARKRPPPAAPAADPLARAQEVVRERALAELAQAKTTGGAKPPATPDAFELPPLDEGDLSRRVRRGRNYTPEAAPPPATLPAVQGVSRPAPIDPQAFDEWMGKVARATPEELERMSGVVIPKDLPPVGEDTFGRIAQELLDAAGPESQVWSETARLRAGMDRGPPQPGTKRAMHEAALKRLAQEPAAKPSAKPAAPTAKRGAKKASAPAPSSPLTADEIAFMQAASRNDPRYFMQILQTARARGLSREQARKLAELSAWPEDAMRAGGLSLERAQTALKAADPLERARSMVDDADELVRGAAKKPRAIRKKKDKP